MTLATTSPISTSPLSDTTNVPRIGDSQPTLPESTQTIALSGNEPAHLPNNAGRKKARKPAPPVTPSLLLQTSLQATSGGVGSSGLQLGDTGISLAQGVPQTSKPFGYSRLLRELLSDDSVATETNKDTLMARIGPESRKQVPKANAGSDWVAELEDLPTKRGIPRDLTDTGKVRLDNGLQAIANALKQQGLE
ncbi:hypothetical protein OIV83_002681 [Microbotryomycetes sp. JL201]|nr:hypothetical protein OIV83_002681 [Microbotryomycetes sp. JL201]